MNLRIRVLLGFTLGVLLSWGATAQSNEECFLCHGMTDLVGTDEFGNEQSLFVDAESYAASVHGVGDCIMCHTDITEVPHAPELAPVECGACHFDAFELFSASLHGEALANDDPLAPDCATCHGEHNILPISNPHSTTNPIHIPDMCGQCHAEDAPVALERNIDQHDILENYVESIHGEGILKKGLTVTATCTSCHTAHSVLDHTNIESTIHRDNVVQTCTQCHSLIEEVHRKVINGELWEAEPHNVPVCVDCHQPHAARKVFYDEGVSDRDCMACHAETVDLAAGGILAAVDTEKMAGAAHTDVRCAQCHTGAIASLARPCEPVSSTVDCSICHADQVDLHAASIHGQFLAAGDPDAPGCLDCHAGHATQRHTDPTSPTFPRNIPDLCGRCHREGERVAARGTSSQTDVIQNYSMSIHGQGLLDSGLLVTATCVDCHTAHSPLQAVDAQSTVNPANIAQTCGNCHDGIQETFLTSIHSPLLSPDAEKLPVCSTCHTAHSIGRTDEESFKVGIINTCGECHAEVTESYFDTYHGKVSKLGAAESAKCHDCHGAHNILPPSNAASTLGHDNIVATCAQCHPGSHRQFAGYLTHATHHDSEKYPALYYTYWAMTALLVGTFAFFGLHTLAWLPMSLKERRRMKALADASPKDKMYRRFSPIIRQMHFVLILSFFGLAITGMVLKFSYMPWAQTVSTWLGGFSGMSVIHRVCAVVMFFLFVFHLFIIAQHKRRAKKSWKDMLLGTSSLVPQWRDVKEFFQTMKWFLGKGPKPAYGKWTYWEKFDYFAVFWGIAIIGSTGLTLWFPEAFTRVFPGWFINVATIIHSDEALLATGFIFTIHFFNTQFRPEKFPMDMVMFTGRMPLEELKEERPQLYNELKESGELEANLREDAPKEIKFWGAIFGAIALFIGFSLVLLIIYSMIFVYK